VYYVGKSCNDVIEVLRDLINCSKAVFIGVGNELRGDDGVGIYIAEKLVNAGLGNVVVCHMEPMNCLESVFRDYDVDAVFIIDAVESSLEPGTIIIGTLDEVSDIMQPHSTHSIPLNILVKLLTLISSKNIKVYVIGIQILNTELLTNISPEVLTSANEVVNALTKLYLSSSTNYCGDGDEGR